MDNKLPNEITITLNIAANNTARTLNDWASVGRSFDVAISLLNKFYDSIEDESLKDDIYYAAEELQLLKMPLENIHGQIRSELWKITGGVIKYG